MPRKAQGKSLNGKGLGLGRSLTQNRAKKRHKKQAKMAEFAMHHITDVVEKEDEGLKSITERNDLEEFLNYTMLADTNFHKESGETVLLSGPEIVQRKELVEIYDYEVVSIPRKPAWTRTMSADELHRQENEAFLQWRQHLAVLDEKSTKKITPFEKNLGIWKQLWRVVERSDILVQIVDARNPLLFRSPDLEKYVMEQGADKQLLLLINKSDFLSVHARRVWADYFESIGVQYLFFSAALEQEKLDEELKKEREMLEEQKRKDIMDLELSYITGKFKELEENKLASESENDEEEPDEEDDEESGDDEGDAGKLEDVEERLRLLTADDLVSLFDDMGAVYYDAGRDRKTRVTIGMVGYPNVGKSSTINVIMKQKKVSVAATPGKTKNYQTLNLGEKFMLMDCPGLVFPTFTSSKEDQVCNGIFPIDMLKTYTDAADLVAQRISRSQFAEKYGMLFDANIRVVTGQLLLYHTARLWGFMKDKGRPDESRSARLVLKDFVSGKLLYCHPPPNLTEDERTQFFQSFFLKNPNALSSKESKSEGKTTMEKAMDANVLINMDVTREKIHSVKMDDEYSIQNVMYGRKPGHNNYTGRLSAKELNRQKKLRRKMLKADSRAIKSTAKALKNDEALARSVMAPSVVKKQPAGPGKKLLARGQTVRT